MFTGIIRATGEVQAKQQNPQGLRLQILAPSWILEPLETGMTSIALAGACHTVEEVLEGAFRCFSSVETLNRTRLGRLQVGDRLNLELPVTPQTFLDGHVVQGHVDGLAFVEARESHGESLRITFRVAPEWAGFLVDKDSIALDGVSLTVCEPQGARFFVELIPETLKHCTLSALQAGDAVHCEINLFAKYAATYAARYAWSNNPLNGG